MPELIKVAARVRPADDPRDIAVSTDEIMNRVTDSNGRAYIYDAVFGMNISQDAVFSSMAKPIIEACVNGYNGTVFVYGQTGSGKTYTMLGAENNADKRGLIPRSLEHLFGMLEKEREKKGATFQHSCKCSFVELYNEELYDLLDEKSNEKLRLRQSDTVIVEGAAEAPVLNCNEAMEILMQGWKNREVAETAMNRESSRSHAIFIISLETTCEYNGIINRKRSRINLVDLAGSERQENTKASGARLKEAASINKSLSVLARVIDRLSQNAIKRENGHVPYRDSKLTHLLSDSLGGNARTAVIVNVHPNSRFLAQTISTLKFAENVKHIENVAKVNEDVTSRDIEAWKAEILRLKKELARAKENGVSSEEHRKAKHREEELENQVNMLKSSLIDCETRLKSSEETVEVRDQNISLLLELQKHSNPDLPDLFKEYQEKCLAALEAKRSNGTPIRNIDALTVQGLKKELRAARKMIESLEKENQEYRSQIEDGNIADCSVLSERQRKNRRRTRYTPHDDNVNARRSFQPVLEPLNVDSPDPLFLDIHEDEGSPPASNKMEKGNALVELTRLQEALEAKENEFEELRRRFDEERSALEEAKAERDTFAEKVSRLERDLKTHVESVASKDNELSKKEMQFDTERSKLIKECQGYSSQLVQVNEELATIKEDMKEKLRILETELEEKKEENESLILESSKMEVDLVEKEKQLGEKNETIEKLRAERSEIEKKINSYSSQLDAKEKEVVEMKNEKDSLEDELRKRDEEMAKKDDLLSQLKEKYSKLNDEKTKLIKEHEEFRKQLESASSDESREKELKEKFETLAAGFNAERSSLLGKIDETKAKNDSLQREILKMESDLKEKEEKLEEKSQLLEKQGKERDEEKSKHLNESLDTKNEEIQGLKEALATKEREFKEEIESLTAAFNEQKSSLEARLEQTQERSETQAEECKKMKGDLKEREKDLAATTKLLEKLKKESAALETERAELIKERDDCSGHQSSAAVSESKEKRLYKTVASKKKQTKTATAKDEGSSSKDLEEIVEEESKDEAPVEEASSPKEANQRPKRRRVVEEEAKPSGPKETMFTEEASSSQSTKNPVPVTSRSIEPESPEEAQCLERPSTASSSPSTPRAPASTSQWNLQKFVDEDLIDSSDEDEKPARRRSTRTSQKAQERTKTDECKRNPRWQRFLNRSIQDYLKTTKKNDGDRDWSSVEIADLAEFISKFGCDDKALESNLFQQYLPKRSVDEVKRKIVDSHQLMAKSDVSYRESIFAKCDKPESEEESKSSEKSRDHKWFSCIKSLQAARANEVGDVSTESLSAVLSCIAEGRDDMDSTASSSSSSSTSHCTAVVDYRQIYKEMIKLVKFNDFRRVSTLPTAESAVLLSIIDEIEREVDLNLGYRMPAYKTLFRDLKRGHFEEFAFCRQLKLDKEGAAHINLFGLTDEQKRVWRHFCCYLVGDQSMFELVVVAISLSAIFVPVFSVVLCARKESGKPLPPGPELPRYKPGHVPNFADGLDLVEDDTLCEVKTEIAFPSKDTAVSLEPGTKDPPPAKGTVAGKSDKK
ncbi:hypothetical protein QR680_004791 [Steinernema hermaphroditum]|uniref:Kinesin motor domain-containing protein n=1 Tax=Steinernema hermaphroditum TaxID=289476 RepID=A0AA39HS44_9BILA|nr:hypothetical protein QR680_004791 [Steinernema hermaphroditum]